MGQEQRRYFRIDGEWTIVCQPVDEHGVPGSSVGGHTRNLSAGGAELVLHEPLEPGIAIKLRVSADDLRISLPALVIRCDQQEDGGSVAAVAFTDLDRATRADLSRFVFGQARMRAAAAAAAVDDPAD